MNPQAQTSTSTRARTNRAKKAAPDTGTQKAQKLPFADWPHPDPAQCEAACEALSRLHGKPARKLVGGKAKSQEAAGCGDVPHVLDALVHTILSQNTTSANSTRAMGQLRARFGDDWHKVWRAPVDKVAEAIACGGLGNVKAARIKKILDTVLAQHGAFDLDYLHKLPDAEAHAALLAFDGVGPKTASCVLLFCLGRDSFAVDTHVFRISKLLGWVPKQATREQAYLHLDARIPEVLKYPLHVLFVRHGKSCMRCAAHGRPQIAPPGPCPLEPTY